MTIAEMPFLDVCAGLADLLDGIQPGGVKCVRIRPRRERMLKDCTGGCGRKTRYKRCYKCEHANRHKLNKRSKRADTH